MSRHYTLHDEATLVSQLNHLLHALGLPFSLISPTDLTPRLLIAILESLLGARLPTFQISSAHSTSNPNSNSYSNSNSDVDTETETDARTARVQNMKIFLGVLETDILQRDAGLSTVDPRRLADGEDAEVFYVAEVLCAIPISRDTDRELARARSVPLPRTPSPSPSPPSSPLDRPRPRPPLSPRSQLDLDAESLFQTHSTMRQTHPGLFSPAAPFLAHDSTTTSLFSEHHEDEYGRASDDGGYSDSDGDTGVSDILGGLPPRPSSPPPSHPHPRNGRTNNDADDDSLLFSALINPPIPREQAFSAYHHDPASPSSNTLNDADNSGARLRTRPPVRYSGFIEPVDEAQELASFALSRSRSQSRSIGSQSQSHIDTSTASRRSAGLLSAETAPRLRPSTCTPGQQRDSVKAQYTRTLELLNERARLLTQLSELRGAAAAAAGYGRGYGHEYGYKDEDG